MKKLALSYFAIIMLAIPSITTAQDVIVLRSGEEILSKVTEITSHAVKYRRFDNVGGPVYTIEKSKIQMITYQNGTREVFNVVETITEKEQNENPLPKSSININPLGLIQFGPIFQCEVQIANSLYLTPFFRYAFLGVIYHVVWEVETGVDQMAPSAIGLGLGVKGFSKNFGNTWYYAAFAEYNYTKVNWGVDQSYETEEIAKGLSILGNFGYRWRKSTGSYINVGLYAGMVLTLSDEERSVSDGSLIDTYNNTVPVGFLELSFGLDLKKN